MKAQHVARRTLRRMKDPSGNSSGAKTQLLALLEQVAARLGSDYTPSSPAEWLAAKWYGVDVPDCKDERALSYLTRWEGL